MLLAALLACDRPGLTDRVDDRVCDDLGESRVAVVRSLTFVRGEGTVSDGFDLDGVVGGPEGCGITDFTSPDGEPGVDNAFAYILPALELTEAAAVESLIQQAIDDGRLLVTFELSEVDDEVDDECVDVVVGRGAGVPMIGTDGKILPGQTILRDEAAPSFEVDDAVLEGGTIETPFEITLPVTIFDLELEFAILDGRMRATIADDGTMTGIFAGGADVAYLLQIAQEENVDPGLYDIVAALLGAWADLAPDASGVCTQVSIGFAFEAVPVFFFE